tara:strand:+ start:330 stop:533 length:204 start_codon:yes stop_codon:yes gene_type:complete
MVQPTRDGSITAMVAELKCALSNVNHRASELTELGCKVEVEVLGSHAVKQKWTTPILTVSIMKEVPG